PLERTFVLRQSTRGFKPGHRAGTVVAGALRDVVAVEVTAHQNDLIGMLAADDIADDVAADTFKGAVVELELHARQAALHHTQDRRAGLPGDAHGRNRRLAVGGRVTGRVAARN